VAALEARVDDLAGQTKAARDDAAAARHLAAASDRDVAEIATDLRNFRQATIGSFNALRSDFTDLQGEMRTGFSDLRTEMAELQADMGAGFAEVRGRLDGAAAGFEQITRLLTTLIAAQDADPGETD
jgi:hypothetical protein